VPSVHTWPAWHGIRHPPQLAWSLEVSTHFPKQNICSLGHCRPCAFAANWVMQRNRPIVSPASKALLLIGQTLRLYDGPAIRNSEDATMPCRVTCHGTRPRRASAAPSGASIAAPAFLASHALPDFALKNMGDGNRFSLQQVGGCLEVAPSENLWRARRILRFARCASRRPRSGSEACTLAIHDP
jgi:hypothetical protein